MTARQALDLQRHLRAIFAGCTNWGECARTRHIAAEILKTEAEWTLYRLKFSADAAKRLESLHGQPHP